MRVRGGGGGPSGDVSGIDWGRCVGASLAEVGQEFRSDERNLQRMEFHGFKNLIHKELRCHWGVAETPERASDPGMKM